MMALNELMLSEFDGEMKNTRVMLERVPFEKTGFAPHPKSMTLDKLAIHVAELPNFGVTILTTEELDFSKEPQRERPAFAAAALMKAFEEGAGKARAALQKIADEDWTRTWKLSFQGKQIFNGSKFTAYRMMFLNHLIHHRAQLGVYLRLNDKPLPAIYGPSADDKMGF